MKYLHLAICFIMLSKVAYSQNNAQVFLVSYDDVPIYQTNKCDDVVMYVHNDSTNESYYIFDILCIDHEMAYVSGFDIISNRKASGWINKEMLGLYLTMDDTILLYKRPFGKLKKDVIAYPQRIPVSIIDVSNNWLKILYDDSLQRSSGWLPKRYQCANPYTICN